MKSTGIVKYDELVRPMDTMIRSQDSETMGAVELLTLMISPQLRSMGVGSISVGVIQVLIWEPVDVYRVPTRLPCHNHEYIKDSVNISTSLLTTMVMQTLMAESRGTKMEMDLFSEMKTMWISEKVLPSLMKMYASSTSIILPKRNVFFSGGMWDSIRIDQQGLPVPGRPEADVSEISKS